jgi:hypothetical protein
MKSIVKRALYKKPSAIDLSVSVANGGMCMAGRSPSSPVSTCTNGDYPSSDPLTCSPTGLSAQYGKCAVGTNVVNICVAGSLVTA